MRSILLTLVLIHVALLSFSQEDVNVVKQVAAAQDHLANELPFEVYRIYPPLSITNETLHSAKTLMDLNQYYKPSWVRRYVSIELLTSVDGKLTSAISKDANLSQEQKENMYHADFGSDVKVTVKYIPENTLINNDMKEFDFKFTVDPELEASYSGGQAGLKQFLKKHAIDNIPANSFEEFDLAIIKFIVNEDGQIIDPQVFGSSNSDEIDALLVETIQKMTGWTPAAYSNGKKTSQEFAFTVGNQKSCTLNLINVHRDRPALAE